MGSKDPPGATDRSAGGKSGDHIAQKSISSKPFIPLREELETIDSYVEVQKIRFTGRFLCEKEIPDQLEECLVPKMILQPLVENAIIHGLEGCENGYICIYAGREGDVLNISITDDGRGMSPEILAWINSPEPEKRERRQSIMRER